MELYITVSFWLGIFAIVVNMLILMVGEFPQTRTETVGYKVAQVLISGAFAVWAGILLYAN